MAEIDKSLPNAARGSIEIPSEEELQQEVIQNIQEEVEQPEDIEIIETEEGGVEVNFDPSTMNPEGGQDHRE